MIGNGWVRACSTKHDDSFVRIAMGVNPSWNTDLGPLLDNLQELLPLPHYADKYLRMGNWLSTACERLPDHAPGGVRDSAAASPVLLLVCPSHLAGS